MTNADAHTQNELHELEQRFGPGLGQYVYDQLIQTNNVVSVNRSVKHNHKVPESSYYKKAA